MHAAKNSTHRMDWEWEAGDQDCSLFLSPSSSFWLAESTFLDNQGRGSKHYGVPKVPPPDGRRQPQFHSAPSSSCSPSCQSIHCIRIIGSRTGGLCLVSRGAMENADLGLEIAGLACPFFSSRCAAELLACAGIQRLVK